MSASLRADSLAWAACKLLYRHRKPSVCHDHIVTGFTDRYGFLDAPVTREMKALPFSHAEHELRGLLRVIAKSEPLTRATCIESFAFHGAGFYKTHIFACGAPNALDFAYVGVHATAFKELNQYKAWLTVDTLTVMGYKYVLRQNVNSEFTAQVSGSTGAVTLTPNSKTNFSSSGGLYGLMVVIDVVLLLLNLWSALEIARLMIVPLVHAYLTNDGDDDSDEQLTSFVNDYKTGFTSALYRSRVVVLLMATTQLISWVIILPNSIIFTWSTSSKMAKIQAYLSSLRLWVLILMLLNEACDLVVLLNERLAYHVVRFTYIASYEILAIGALVSYQMRANIFAVGNAKYALENQRTKDATSYIKRLTLQNAYNEELDFQFNTPTNILWVLYKQLVVIILWSAFYCVLLLLVRYLYYRVAKPLALGRLAGGKYAPKILAQNGHHDGHQNKQHEPQATATAPSKYERLPLGLLLNDPIRARSLVRASFDIETTKVDTKTKRPQRLILPAYFLEYGVFVDPRGQMRARHGFFKFLQPKVKFNDYLFAEATASYASLHHQKSDTQPMVVAVTGANCPAKGREY